MIKNKTLKGYIVNTIVIFLMLLGLMIIQNAMVASGHTGYKLKFVPSFWQCCYLIIMAASLNLVLGYLGLLSLGHCGFMGIGAYTAALVSLVFERAGAFVDKTTPTYLLIIVLSLLAAGLLAAIVGIVVGIPALRLKGDYLAIITLGFGMIIVNVINNLPFAGQNGLGEGAAAASLYATGLGFGSTLKITYIWVAVFTTLFSIVVKIGRAHV